MSEPSLHSVTAATCPPDKPFKCLPYGMCYSFDSYCNKAERDVASCFPPKVSDDRSKLVSWCADVLQGKESLLDPQCQCACAYRLNLTSNVVQTPSGDASPWMIGCIILATLLIISFTVNVVSLCMSKRRRGFRPSYQPLSNEKKTESTGVEDVGVLDEQNKDGPTIDLKRQVSLNTEENTVGDAVSTKPSDPCAGNGGIFEGQQPPMGVTIRSRSCEQLAEGGLKQDDQDMTYEDDDRSSASSFGRSQRGSPSSSNISTSTENMQGFESSDSGSAQTARDGGVVAVEEETQRQRAHHAPATNCQENERSEIVTNVQSYNRE